MGDSRFGDPKHSVDISLECGIEIFCGERLNRFAKLLTTRIIDEDIQPTQPFYRLFNQLAAKSFISNISGDSHDISACFFYQVDHFTRIVFFIR